MPRGKRSGPFWQAWTQAQQSQEGTPTDTDPRAAWRQHFAAFLGVAPEKHWLFGGRRFKPWISGRWGPPGRFNPFVATILSKGGGLLSLFVLHLLAEKPRYGNDIMREIEGRTRGRWGSNPGAVYPLLDAMEERGLVEGEWEDPEKRTRRIYRLNPSGARELERLKEVMRPKLEEAIRIMRHLHDDLEIEVEG
ncbi:MAG: PadR family transcriptional regulator [Anaerolineae bacterium]